MLADEGYEVLSLDIDPKFNPTIVADVLEWDLRAAYPVGHFDVVFACPPCDQMSRARTTKQRDMITAERLVARTLEIVRHFRPALWFIENPRGGLMKTLPCMADIPYVDLDYCQVSTWGYQKPTRFWGGAHVQELEPRLCNTATCPNIQLVDGRRVHHDRLGGNNMHFSREKKYRIP